MSQQPRRSKHNGGAPQKSAIILEFKRGINPWGGAGRETSGHTHAAGRLASSGEETSVRLIQIRQVLLQVRDFRRVVDHDVRVVRILLGEVLVIILRRIKR